MRKDTNILLSVINYIFHCKSIPMRFFFCHKVNGFSILLKIYGLTLRYGISEFTQNIASVDRSWIMLCIMIKKLLKKKENCWKLMAKKYVPEIFRVIISAIYESVIILNTLFHFEKISSKEHSC